MRQEADDSLLLPEATGSNNPAKSALRLRTKHVMWVLAVTNNNLVTASIVLNATVGELRQWLDEHGIPEVRYVQKLDTLAGD